MFKAVQTGTQQGARTANASAARIHRPPHLTPTAPTANQLTRLQSNPGNQYTQRLLNRGVLQAKLTVNQPGDAYEQEADRVADAVMRMPDPAMSAPVLSGASQTGVQRCTCGKSAGGSAQCEECKTNDMDLHRVSSGAVHTDTAPPIVHDVLRSPGQPLDSATRAFMEPRIGHDFSQVRLHTDAKAAESAHAVNAMAYTVGNDVVFGEGKYSNSTTGRRLLAHELAHTVQQGAGASRVQRQAPPRKVLVAPRFVGNAQLDRALNNELLIQVGSTGPAVRLIQEALLAEGYTLPQFGVDGDFGAETEAAVKQFQTDAGAVKKDGIIGPETMQLLDQHDPTNLAGLGAVRKVGPVPGPRPAPAPGCGAPYTGVTFALANQVATGVAPAAIIGIGLLGGRPFLRMAGIAAANYQPRITITAPNNPKAQEFEVGFISNLLTSRREANFAGGHVVRTTVPAPMKDGAPLATGDYDAIFVQVPAPGVRENFTATGATVNLNWPDTPGDGNFVNLTDNAPCAAFGAAAMANMVMNDTFRTWVAVRHRPTGCVQALHHIDWNLLWSANVTPGAPLPAAAVTSNVINVTQPNGNGAPGFIQGGRVPGDVAAKTCV